MLEAVRLQPFETIFTIALRKPSATLTGSIGIVGGQFNIVEYQMFERCYQELKQAGPISIELRAAYEVIKQRLPTNA